MKLPRIGSRWTRDDGKVYVVTMATRSGIMAGSGPQVILVEEKTGYPRVHTTPGKLEKHWTPVPPEAA